MIAEKVSLKKHILRKNTKKICKDESIIVPEYTIQNYQHPAYFVK